MCEGGEAGGASGAEAGGKPGESLGEVTCRHNSSESRWLCDWHPRSWWLLKGGQPIHKSGNFVAQASQVVKWNYA